MSLPALGRAHLLRILATLPQAEWPAAAAAAGFVSRPEKKQAKLEPARAPRPPEPKPPPPPPRPEPYRPGDLPDLPFWRIAAHRLLSAEEWPDGAPAWLEETAPWDKLPQSDPHLPQPEHPVLVPRARQARFLRWQLASGVHGDAIDLAGLCRLLAERRIPARLPRLVRLNWPARVCLLIDLSPQLRPFHGDFWRWSAQLRQTLGQRVTRLSTRTGYPSDLEAVEPGTPTRPRLDDAPLVILGDVGLYAQGSPRYRAWLAFGQRCTRAGMRPLLLAPCPARYLTKEIVAVYRCVLLERGAKLHPVVQRRGIAGRHESENGPPVPSPVTDDLLAALAAGARTEPPLLRALRLALAERGSDIGCEYEAWNHPGVVSDELACALRPASRAEAGRAIGRLPEVLRAELTRIRQDGNRHLSPLVRLEESLAAGDRMDSEEGRRALAEARRYAATLYQVAPERLRQALAAYIAGMGRRRPELLARYPELAMAWALAYPPGDLPPPPAGVSLKHLAWLVGTSGPSRPVYLGQVGDMLGVHAAAPDRQPLCRLAEFETEGDYWQLEAVQEPAAQDPATSIVLRLGEEATPSDPDRRQLLTLGRHRLELEAVHRPVWAVGMGRGAEGLFAELADGRRVYWVPKGRMRIGNLTVTTSSFDTEEVEVKSLPGNLEFDLPHGFWWDELEYRAYLEAGRALLPPPWATRHGVDEYGWWVEFEVRGVAQRMRWIQPGEFRMGSPEDEPQRYGEGEWAETQHPVLLTQGFWLADTACTQALWRAVLGEAPSRFEGEDLPVDSVSWDNITKRFLPALNKLLPGLEAGLPSEAQWEYACRAGTQTPFWFGENITPGQVNYDGNLPYANGPKGEYRERTVPAKALPGNGWGLYQMHGNVWEWCADWLGGYPSEAVVDPLGPSEGRRRVLRGGGWSDDGRFCRSADRGGGVPGYRFGSIGFRLARGYSPRQKGSVGVAGVAAGGGAPAAAPDSPARGLGKVLKTTFRRKRKK